MTSHRIRALMQQVEQMENSLDSSAYRQAVARYRDHGEVPDNPLLRAWLRSWREDIVAAWASLNVDLSDRYPPLPEEVDHA